MYGKPKLLTFKISMSESAAGHRFSQGVEEIERGHPAYESNVGGRGEMAISAQGQAITAFLVAMLKPTSLVAEKLGMQLVHTETHTLSTR
jgi:hypothetical protein